MLPYNACLAVLLLSSTAWAQAPPGHVIPHRIINDEKATRDKRDGAFERFVGIPLFPLKLIGGGMERGLVAVERRGWHKSAAGLQLPEGPLRPKQGFTPLFGGFDMGARFAVGVKYWRNFGDGLRLEIPSRMSTNLYKLGGVNFIVRPNSPMQVEFGAQYLARPEDDFYGTGPTSNLFSRTNYDLRERSAYLRPTWRLSRSVLLRGLARFSSTSIFDGKDQDFADADATFPTLPGMSGGRMFTTGGIFEHDTRETTGMPAGGGLEHIAVSRQEGLGEANFGYWKYRVELMRFLPLASKRRVLALRFFGESNQPVAGKTVPFFDMPILGGPFNLRGFREFRYYDQTAALATAEYRFKINGWMAPFLFVDEGQVARWPGDLTWSNFRTAYGGGVRLFTDNAALFTVSLGHSREGTRLYFLFQPRF